MNRVPKPGERWRWDAGDGRLEQEVEIRDYAGGFGIFTTTLGDVLVHPDGRPAVGTLAPVAAPPASATPVLRPVLGDDAGALERFREVFKDWDFSTFA